MERLTQRHDEFDEIGILNPNDPEGFYEITDLDSDEDKELLLKVAGRLEQYEDTGFEPDEIIKVVKCRDCKKQNTAMCKNKAFATKADSWFTTFNDDDFCSYGLPKE